MSLFESEELRGSFGVAAHEAVQRLRWSNVADAVAAMYESLLALTPRPPLAVVERGR